MRALSEWALFDPKATLTNVRYRAANFFAARDPQGLSDSLRRSPRGRLPAATLP
jgi:hypothetical protein